MMGTTDHGGGNDWWWKDSNISRCTADIQLIIMSDAGKPLFSSFSGITAKKCTSTAESKFDSQIARFCGMIQAIRSNALLKIGQGDIQSICTPSIRMVFLTKGELTFVATSTGHDTRSLFQESVLRLHLDLLYSQAVFHMTDNHIQAAVNQNAAIDWNTILRPSCNAPSILKNTSVPVCYPISQAVRHQVSLWLQAQTAVDSVYYCFLFHGDQLVSFVQPDYVPNQLHASDIVLLKEACVGKGKLQSSHSSVPKSGSSQLWFPVCLPRLDASASLHCCVTTQSHLTMILLTPSPHELDNVRALANSLLPQQMCPTDISIDDSASSEDYEMIPRQPLVAESESPLLSLREALMTRKPYPYPKGDCNHAIQNFYFRKKIVVQPSRRRRRGRKDERQGQMYQSIQSPQDREDDPERQKVYDELCLRLRFGITDAAHAGEDGASLMNTIESIPDHEAVCYTTVGMKTYLAMNGKDFELYV